MTRDALHDEPMVFSATGVVGTCPMTGKIAYGNRRAAERVYKLVVRRDSRRRRRGEARGRLNVYRCTTCGSFHLGAWVDVRRRR